MTFHCRCGLKEVECDYPKCANGEWDARKSKPHIPQAVHDVLPERDTTKPVEQQGMFRKFEVRRVDGSDEPGGKHHGCRYFVLDLDHDPHAAVAMAAYAQACRNTHPALSAELVAEYPLDLGREA